MRLTKSKRNQSSQSKQNNQLVNSNTNLSEKSPILTESIEPISNVKSVVNHTSFAGPIPHPEIFREYGEIIPDAPERILRVFEDDSKHVRDMQVNAPEAEKQDNKRVHWMAFCLIISGFVLSAFFAWIDKDWLSGTILATTLGGTITGFLQNKKQTGS